MQTAEQLLWEFMIFGPGVTLLFVSCLFLVWKESKKHINHGQQAYSSVDGPLR
jgi:hypothetical protein